MGDHPFLDEYRLNGSPDEYLKVARQLESSGERRLAASAIDRAYGLAPSRPDIAEFRQNLLDSLAMEEDGIRFRYIPAGTFLMGSEDGDPDERPVHPVKTGEYWLSETPVSLATYARVMGYNLLPQSILTRDRLEELRKKNSRLAFSLLQSTKIWRQYCEHSTRRAKDWHAHALVRKYDSEAEPLASEQIFGPVLRDATQPPRFETKPLVAVCCDLAEEFCRRLSTPARTIRLPKESEWEKGARGGLVAARYPWGDNPPSHQNCDFDRFDEFSIKPFRTFPANGYALYTMSGGVWEWTSDSYDANSYISVQAAPSASHEQVVRGGSWADCADAVTVSFRMSLDRFCMTPNVGFRLCRIEHETKL